MKIDIREEDEKLYVYVEVPHEGTPGGTPAIRLETSDICALLDEREIKYGDCLKKDSVRNWRENTRKGEWIFEIPLDKVLEPVILKEEKSVRPKPKRPRRTRSSTKKISTED